jgi:hypothetical protein
MMCSQEWSDVSEVLSGCDAVKVSLKAYFHTLYHTALQGIEVSAVLCCERKQCDCAAVLAAMLSRWACIATLESHIVLWQMMMCIYRDVPFVLCHAVCVGSVAVQRRGAY